jgi:MFS family permease
VARRFGASDATAGTLLTTTALFATLSSPLWGGLSDRFGRKRALIGSQLLSFAGYIVLALAPDIALLFFSRVVEGLGGGNVGVAQSYISDVTDEEQRPRAFAYSSAAFGAGFIVGPILSGSLVHFGYAVPFFVAAAVQLLNAILTLTLLPESHGSRANSSSSSPSRTCSRPSPSTSRTCSAAARNSRACCSASPGGRAA